MQNSEIGRQVGGMGEAAIALVYFGQLTGPDIHRKSGCQQSGSLAPGFPRVGREDGSGCFSEGRHRPVLQG